jgi:hypothetical protein
MELDGYFEILIMYMYLQNENGLNLKKIFFYFFHIYEFFFILHQIQFLSYLVPECILNL